MPVVSKGEWHVIHSVVGQNERWAQLTALQQPPAAQSGQGGPAFSNLGTTTADPTVVNPVAGSTASPLSSNMSFMLMMFGGGLDSAAGSGAAGGSGLTSGSGSTTASPDDTANTQGGTGAASILADLQSLMASLTGGYSGSTASGGATAPAGSDASSSSSSLLQGLDSIVTDRGTTVAAAGSAQPPPPPSSGASTGQPSDGNDITNSGSAAADATWGDGPSGPGGGWQEQYALAAYVSGNLSGLSSASGSALQSLTV
jgi:hypothetical protein